MGTKGSACPGRASDLGTKKEDPETESLGAKRGQKMGCRFPEQG